MFEQVKQEIDNTIKTNGNNEITATRLNDVLQDMMDAAAEEIEKVAESVGDQVEANPTGEATTPLNKIKIGETNYNIPQTDTSDLATKQELQQGLAGKADKSDTYTKNQVNTALANKADKVANATPDNFAAFDANGGIKDSTYKAADFAPIDQAVPNPQIGDEGKILGYETQGGVQWVLKPQDGKSALQIYNEEYGTNLDEAQFINVLKQNYPMEYVAYNQAAAEQPIGTGFASIGTFAADSTTAGKLYLMPNNGTTPTGTILFVTVQTPNSNPATYQWYSLGALSVPSNVLTEDDIDNSFTGGSDKVAGADEVKQLNMQINGGDVIEGTVDGTEVWTDINGIVNYSSADNWYYWDVNSQPQPRNSKIIDLNEYKQVGYNKIEIKSNQERSTIYSLFNDSFTPNTQTDIVPSVLLTMLSEQMEGVGFKPITANNSLVINIDTDVRYIVFRDVFKGTSGTYYYAPSVVTILKQTEVSGIVYDGLDSDAIDKALSAKQGKLLNETVQGFADDIDAINTELDGSDLESTTEYDFSDFTRTSNNICVISNGNVTTSSNYKGIKINLPENITKIVAKTTRGDGLYYGVSLFSSTSISQTSFLEGYRPSIEGGLVELTNIRSDAKAVLVSCKNSHTDSYVDIITTSHTDGIKDNVNSLNTEVQEIQEHLIGIGNESLYNGVVYPKATAASLADGEIMYVSGYPIGSKSRGETIVFRANITTFSKLSIGKSIISGAFGSNYSSWLEIDTTNVVIKKNTGTTAKTIAHGLTIQNTITVIISTNDDGKTKIILGTVGDSAESIQKVITIELYSGDGGTTAWQSNNYGYVKVLSTGSTLTDWELSVSNKHLRDPFWIFGASFDTTDDETCWPYYSKLNDFYSFYINANPGRNSAVAFADLQRALALGTPKYLLWTMWGNDSAADLDTYIGNVKSLCDEKGIVLIIVDRPNSPTSSSQYAARKQVIDSYINAGVRYWNIAAAVSSNPSDANSWYDGYLQNDGQHPTALGSRAMAMQLLVDVPEVMQF